MLESTVIRKLHRISSELVECVLGWKLGSLNNVFNVRLVSEVNLTLKQIVEKLYMALSLCNLGSICHRRCYLESLAECRYEYSCAVKPAFQRWGTWYLILPFANYDAKFTIYVTISSHVSGDHNIVFLVCSLHLSLSQHQVHNDTLKII